MKLLVLHLCDVHLRQGSPNPVMDRAAAVANAAHGAAPDAEFVLLALTGDIAYGGLKEEYNLAKSFLEVLLSQLRARNPKLQRVMLAAIPGNHDCYLQEDQTARDKLITDLTRTELQKSSIVTALADPQRHFYDFLESALPAEILHGGRDAVHRVDISIGAASVELLLLNTALCSRKHEREGTLRLPPIVDPSSTLPAIAPSLSLILAHHPPHWLDAESYHEVRTRVIETQALLLTGHEHNPSLWQLGKDETLSHLIEGGVLQHTNNAATSSFHTIVVDFGSSQLVHRTFTWKQNIYIGSEPRPMAWIGGSTATASIKLSLQQNHAQTLEDPGMLISHARRSTLKLSDIFVLPELRAHGDPLKKDRTRTLVKRDELAARLLSQRASLVFGGPRCGKTSLAKQLFATYWRDGDLPLLVRGDEIRTQSAARLREKLDEAVKKNYRVHHPDEYFNSGHRLILIADDFQLASPNRKFQNTLVEQLSTHFDNVILFDRASIDLHDIVEHGDVLEHLQTLAQYDIMPLSHLGRADLVEKWVLLGTSPADSEANLQAEVLETQRLISTLLGRDLVPPTPFYVVSILSALSQGGQPTADLGSLGYLYETMIRGSLTKAVKQPDMLLTYDRFLADLAFGMYQQHERAVTEETFKGRCDEYASRFLIPFDSAEALSILVRANILARDGQHIFFRYPYTFLFFVARYLSQRLSTEPGQAEVKQLTQQLHRSESSNVLLFLCHCTSDPFVVESVALRAKELFAADNEVDLDPDSAFLNEVSADPSKLALGGTDPESNRKSLLKEKDRSDEATRLNQPGDTDSLADHSEVSDEAPPDDEEAKLREELSASLKIVEIVGQILRNHPTIEGKDKIELVKQCTSLARRMLSSFLASTARDAPSLIAAVEQAIQMHAPHIDPARARMFSSTLFKFYAETTVVGIISTYAAHLSVPNLNPVFKRVRAEYSDKTMQLFDLAVKLEDPRTFPEADALAADKVFKKNVFVWNCIRGMVFVYFYLFPVTDYRQRHRVCTAFGIDVQTPEILSNRTKRILP